MQSHTATGTPDPTAAQLDFRTFIDRLRQDDDLAVIDHEVDPHLEIGAIARRVAELDDKAPLFNNVKGAKDGLWRIFSNAASLRNRPGEKYGRLARNLGLPPTASWNQINHRLMSWKKNGKPLPPNIIPTGPCKENKISGNDIDLTQLPAPLLHSGDGGKYIQTYGLHVLQTPDKEWTNWSIFRGMVHDRNHISCLIGPGQHNSMIRDEWIKTGKTEMPWALAFGVPPAASIVAAMPVPKGVSESEFVGAVVGKPLDLVKCETNDLLVPANSEIVFEGTFNLTEKGPEGPFGDYLGLVFDGEEKSGSLFKVNMITYRDDAIMPISCPGRITDESHTTAALATAEILSLCEEHGLPITDAFAPLETMALWCALKVDTAKLREMNTDSKTFCDKLAKILYSSKSTMLINRLLIFGDDVDIYDFKNIIWAYTTRCRPGKDEYVFEDVRSFFLTPYMAFGNGDKTGGKTVADCLMKYEYNRPRDFKEVSFAASYPDDLKRKIVDSWKSMGFESS
ncbi:hypothetical protein G7054_g12741 [Neopestalotiopsis clavispora]|nr:hypothetical protein G7054_g12741 [Neopestalotiopsis clavispora]